MENPKKSNLRAPYIPVSRDRMGFFHQYRLLLWKNFTLKKRTPFVLLFELCIPLVLFVILLLIRKKQPAIPVHPGHYKADPLPSSGVVPIMQMFCEGGTEDKYGLRLFPHAKTSQFLNQVQSVAHHHHFFNPGYSPSEMDKLPAIYRSIIDDPAALHDKFENANSMDLSNFLNNTQVFTDFLLYNLSMPLADVRAIMNSSVQLKEVYNILFGDEISGRSHISGRVRRDLRDNVMNISSFLKDIQNVKDVPLLKNSDLENPYLLKNYIDSRLPEISKGLMYHVIDQEGLWEDEKTRNLMLHILSVLGDWNDTSLSLSSDEIASALKAVLFSPTALHRIACDEKEFSQLLVPNDLNNTSYLVDAQERLCNLSHSQLMELSKLLTMEVTDIEIIHVLHLKNVSISALMDKIHAFMMNLEKFYQFQQSLYEMTVLAENLPQDACNGTNYTTPVPLVNVTMETDNSTDTSDSEESEESTTEKTPKEHKKNKYAGFLHIWNTMQRTICGKPAPKLPKKRIENDIKHLDLDDLGISRHQQDNLKILVHVLYSNPKVLYAPNNSAADQIIKKANESFALVDLISEYARKWLNVSAEIRTYLEENKTEHNLESIQQEQSNVEDLTNEDRQTQMHNEIKTNVGLLPNILKAVPPVQRFLNLTIPDIPFFLHELDIIDNAACGWISMLSGINLNVFQGFKSEEDLVEYFLTKAYHENVTTVAGVVFENIKSDQGLPAHVRYKIRQNATFTPTTKYVRNRYWTPGPGPWQHSYYQFGFVWIQDIIERAIIDVQVGRDVVEPGSYVQQFPHSCYLFDQFVYMIEHVMPLCLTISWVYSVSMLVQSIVYEKEQRLKEVMRMMGLSNAVHWCAWFTVTFVQMTVTMGVLTSMLKFGGVLTYSNPWIVFLTLEIFAIVTISFSFLVSTFYSKAKVAAACAGIVYFLTYVPYMYVAIREDVAGDQISAIVKSLVSLFSTTAFGLSGKYFAFYEEEGVGVQWVNISLSPVENDEYSLLTCILMMILDTFLYSILAWYIENVFPGSYGLPKPWYFPFTTTYWCGGQMKAHEMDCSGLFDLCKKNNPYLSVTEEDQACAMEQRDDDYDRKFEPEPAHIPMGVSINNLTKIYKTGKKLAVKNLSLNLFEGQITSFLGHNGAGKTTTMSILTGLFPPTSGYALVYGNDIRTEMDLIRQSLGMCPQHNVLFDKLTVEEHLWFYARLKGMKTEDINQEMETMIEDLGLPKKRHSKVDCLSGGMQRKLSVAIAFVGGSHMVILDEPTAGVDPYARRAIWDLLVKYKHGRTILLSTHHMDEADILGDRIAIISNGAMKCCGSSLFLKNTFGDGYHLYLVKKSSDMDCHSTDTIDVESSNGPVNSFVSRCTSDVMTDFINKYVSTAYLKSETNQELHYILPFEEAKKGNFEKLFQALDSSLPQLHVSSYGVMDTILEEVFLKVTEAAYAEEDNKNEDKPADSLNIENENAENEHSLGLNIQTDNSSPSSNHLQSSQVSPNSPSINNQHEVELGAISTNGLLRSDSDISLDNIQDIGHVTRNGYSRLPTQDDFDGIPQTKLEGRGSYVLNKNWMRLNQFRAIIVKRFHYITRNWKGLFSQIILPALFISVAMTVALSAPKVDDPPPIELSPSQYFNLTQPKGNYIPFSDESFGRFNQSEYSRDANPAKLMNTFHLASGVGSTCVLKSPYNSTFDLDWLKSYNFSEKNFELLQNYYGPDCAKVFVPGVHIPSYIPVVPILQPGEEKKNVSVPQPAWPHSHKPYYPSCNCASDMSGYVCSGPKSYMLPPEFEVVTKDTMQNITGSDTEKFILYTQDAVYRLHRYGVLSFGMQRSSVPSDFGKNSPTLFRKIAVKAVAKSWYNHKGYHAMPVYLNAMNNAILRANIDPEIKGNPAAYGITAVNHPMNQTNNKLNQDYILQGSDVLISIFIIVAMSFVPASFVVFLVYERSIKSKHLQFVSGIDPVMYWLANYVWDMCNYIIPAFCIIMILLLLACLPSYFEVCNYIIPAFCIIMILLIFQIPAYTSPQNLPAVISLFLLYGWSITPVMYPASFWFKEPSAAYISLIVINLFTGITCIVSSFLLEIFSYDKDLKRVHVILKDVFLMFPNYCLGRGLMDIAFNEYKNEFYFKTGQYDQMKSPFTWELTARNLVAMTVVGLCFFLITLLCEFRFFIKGRSHKHPGTILHDEDVDVSAERKRVLRGSGKYDLLRLENLTKVYKTRNLGRHLAVDRLCLGVPAGECFGLLGVNGAGKTTTFKMLTGDISPTSGNAYLNRYSIISDMLQVQRSVGYCPQFDALYDELTAREHIQLYARLRGVPPREEKQVVEWALNKLGLAKYADKPSGTYSGGNKRKLSTAIALVGHPPIIFMDEPTTGMDPYSRRFLWDLILSLVKDGRSVILTSHSMEECEALCSRLAIMVNGQFKCLGSTQHLKNKFGEGYTFCIRLKGPDYERSQTIVQRFIQRKIPEAAVKESHYNFLQYELKSQNFSLSQLFSTLEEVQTDLDIEDYSVSQNTLDNVFINFVKQQVEIVRENTENSHQASNYDDDEPLISLNGDNDDGLGVDDDITFRIDESGTQLSFLNMEDLTV